MKTMENFQPRVTHVATSFRPTRGNWPHILRDALRKAVDKGLTLEEIRDTLGVHVSESKEVVSDDRAVDNTIDYLVTLGLAARRGTRIYDVPVTSSVRRRVA